MKYAVLAMVAVGLLLVGGCQDKEMLEQCQKDKAVVEAQMAKEQANSNEMILALMTDSGETLEKVKKLEKQLKSKVAGLNKSLVKAQKALAGAQGTLKKVKGELQGKVKKINTLKGQVKTMAAQIKDLKADVAKLGLASKSLADELAKAKAKLVEKAKAVELSK